MHDPSAGGSLSSDQTLPDKLQNVLRQLRGRIRRYVVIDSLLAAAAAVLIAFWIGFALDYVPVWWGGSEMPAAARGGWLLATAAWVAAVIGRGLIGRLSRSLPDPSLALLIEKHHPGVGGRLSTAIELSRPNRTGDSHSPKLLAAVTDAAADAVDDVDPARVLDSGSIRRKSLLVAPLAVAVLGIAVMSPATLSQAASRLTLLSDRPWPRRADLRMVGVELSPTTWSGQDPLPPRLVQFDDDRSIRLPIGSSGVLRIRAMADTAEVPQVCTAVYRTDEGLRGQVALRRVGRVRDGGQSFVLDGPPLQSLSDSFTLTIRGLDDALRDYRITAVAPPIITSAEVATRYPRYLREDAELESGDGDAATIDDRRQYQSGMRIREGSRTSLVLSMDRPVGRAATRIVYADAGLDGLSDATGGSAERSSDANLINANLIDEGQSAVVAIDSLTRSATIEIVPEDDAGIAAQSPYRYFLAVVQDAVPEISVRLSGIGSSVTPNARLPVRIIATDDYGLRDVLLIMDGSTGNDDLSDEQSDDPQRKHQWNRPIEVDAAGTAETVADLRSLAESDQFDTPAVGSTLTILGTAVDGYDIGPPRVARSETIQLSVVTPDQLLALLERTELELRSRLEQTASEMRLLRETLDGLRIDIPATTQTPPANTQTPPATVPDESDPGDVSNDIDRRLQILRLRIQQSGLQAGKTRDELVGVIETLRDLVDEMTNNRVDTPDRQERLIDQVATPLTQIVDDPLALLRDTITKIESDLAQPDLAIATAGAAVDQADRVIVQLDAVLEKMLDLESFNEVLDLVRGLIEDQESLIEDTKAEQKRKVLDLFQ